MRTYLVTGGAGFIGSNFIHSIFGKYKDQIFVINLDKLTYAGNLSNLDSIKERRNYTFIKGDICDKELLDNIFTKYDIDFVVNFAAESHVDRSIKNPEVFVKTNVLGSQTLLFSAMKYWKTENGFKGGKKFLQVSTDEVYGSLGESGYFTEETPLDPHSPYSASKAAADLLVKSYFDTYKMPINITRCSNNYGPYQFPEKLIPLAISNCLCGKPVPVYGNGKNVRDWIYVKDHCSALDLVLHEGKPGKVYNIGANCEQRNIDIVTSIIRIIEKNNTISGKKTENELYEFVEDRKGHDWRYAIDSSYIQKELGWKPEITFEVGIEKTVFWYLDNKKWFDSITGGNYLTYYTEMYN